MKRFWKRKVDVVKRLRANDVAKKALHGIKENGSSYHNLENLIKDISLMKVRN